MWVNPKTNWNVLDYFNIEDYNRIKGNIEYLMELSSSMYRLTGGVDMGADKRSPEEYYYADEINALTENLECISQTILFVDIGERITYYENGAFIAWDDLNRIESATMRLYELLNVQKKSIRRLEFRLSGQKGVKC